MSKVWFVSYLYGIWRGWMKRTRSLVILLVLLLCLVAMLMLLLVRGSSEELNIVENAGRG